MGRFMFSNACANLGKKRKIEQGQARLRRYEFLTHRNNTRFYLDPLSLWRASHFLRPEVGD